MTTAYSSLMGLAEPVQGELAGTWGDTVNKGITEYLDIALAGTQTISGSQTAVTLSLTNGDASATNIAQAGAGATGSAQYALINCTGNPAGLLTITVPASSRQYIVMNATSTSQAIKIVGVGPTTGVTLVSGEKAVVAWDGSDYAKVATSLGTGDVVGPSSATSGALAAFSGTTGKLIASANLTANNVLLGNGTGAPQTVAPGTLGNVLTSDGTTWTSATPPGQTYPSAGVAVSTGTAWGASLTAPSGAIVGTTDSQTLTNKTIEAASLTNGYTEEVYALGTSGSLALAPANGSIQTSALTGNPTFTDSLAAGQSIVLMLTNGASYTVTWPTITWVTAAGNTAPTLTAADTLVFWKIGTTLYGAYVGSYA